MREIKFRGKRPNGQWIYGALIPAELSWWGLTSIADKNRRYEVDPETVGQFTGVYDSEEKPVYEGDIIHFLHRKKFRTGVIYYNNGEFRVRNWVDLRHDNLNLVFLFNSIYVIGNIHDNRKLLEGEEK